MRHAEKECVEEKEGFDRCWTELRRRYPEGNAIDKAYFDVFKLRMEKGFDVHWRSWRGNVRKRAHAFLA